MYYLLQQIPTLHFRTQGSFIYTRNVLSVLMVEVREEIMKLGGHKILEALMNALDSQLDVDQTQDLTSHYGANEGQRHSTLTGSYSHNVDTL